MTATDTRARRESLETRIADLEDTLSRLKAELRAEEESEQHAAIDRLEEMFGELDNRYGNLRDFWSILRAEVRDLFTGDQPKGRE